MQRHLIPDLCRIVRSYLFDSITLPTLKVTISGFANGLFYITYKDITITTTLDQDFYRLRPGPYGSYWGWRFQQQRFGFPPWMFRLVICGSNGNSTIMDRKGYASIFCVYLTAEELGNLFTFVESQIN